MRGTINGHPTLPKFSLLFSVKMPSSRHPMSMILNAKCPGMTIAHPRSTFAIKLILLHRSINCWLQPLVVVTATSAQEVATALALCRFFDVCFSVRGGGHLQNPGFTSNNGGVVISLSKFNHVKLSDDKSTADVGLGLSWLDVYKALDPHRLAVAGGRIPTVGVPGLLLGGGISFQNSQYGVGAMGVSSYEVNLHILRGFQLFSNLGAGCPRRLKHCQCQCSGECRLILGSQGRRS